MTHVAVARAGLGDLAGAQALTDSIPRAEQGILILGPQTRLAFKLALERSGRELGPLIDSVYVESLTIQGQVYGMVGKFKLDASRNPAPATRPTQESWLQIFAGVLAARFDSIEAALAAAQPNAIARANMLEMSTLMAFRMRGTGPSLDTAAVHPIRRFQAFLARRDTARARAALVSFDSTLARRAPRTRDDGGWMFAAESYVALGDSARALAIMLDWRERWPTTMKSVTGDRILDQNYLTSIARIWGRSWLLLADLAAAGGQPAEARRAYQMVVNLWDQADAPVQPFVARARAALAR